MICVALVDLIIMAVQTTGINSINAQFFNPVQSFCHVYFIIMIIIHVLDIEFHLMYV